jgi:Spy/CpxP family protein refolding chaperone
MRTLRLKTVILLATIILLGTQTNTFAQSQSVKGNHQANGYYCNGIPEITNEQKSKIQELRVVYMKAQQVTKNQIREKKAHLITLQTADKANMSAINKTIDEITTLQNSQWKKRAAHKQDVRNILTNEQRVYFDVNKRHKGYGNQHKQCTNKNEYGRGSGNPNWNK